MFIPNFSEDSEKLLYHLEEIDRLRFRIERLLIMPKHEQWLRREAFIRTAYSSTMIEDGTISEEEMERVVKLSPVANVPKERDDVANYARALEFVDFLSGTDIMIDQAAILQIHWLLMKGVHDTRLKPGQYRTEPNWIEDQGVRVYEPPFHVDVPILMREFSLWLSEEQDITPILKAGIAHGHFIAIHPFVDGNGRTARLLAILLLQKHGYGFRKLLSLDAYYQRNRDQYLTALKQSLGKRYTDKYDLTPWLAFFTESVVVQALILEERLTDWRIMVDEIYGDLVPLGLRERQIDGLLYAERIGYITRKDYIEITNVSPLTATRDLMDMVGRDILQPEGTGRNRKYILKAAEKGQIKEVQQRKLL